MASMIHEGWVLGWLVWFGDFTVPPTPAFPKPFQQLGLILVPFWSVPVLCPFYVPVLLTLLGDAGESLGMDQLLKANTSKNCTHSLFRQGCMWYQLLPNVPEERLRPLMR